MKNLILIFVILTLFVSCAGPMGPFGSIEIKDILSKNNSNNIYRKLANSSLNSSYKQTRINISPNRLNLHDKEDLKITVTDKKNIPPLSSVHFYYNGLDITHKILNLSTISKDKNSVSYTIKNMTFLAKDDHNFSIAYKRTPFETGIVKNYLYPVCPIKGHREINTYNTRISAKNTLKQIEDLSKKYEINPNFIAGLVAQESSFNPSAISIAKAIGLTQITSLAEDHIVKKYSSWPRYPGISKFSYLKTKALIKLGKINKYNEWRLDQAKSIQGGIEYLKYLNSYWDKKAHKDLVNQTFPKEQEDIFEDIILASYNSGAFRVKTQIKRGGKAWKESRNLKEAKKYIRKVKSYCYQFSGH